MNQEELDKLKAEEQELLSRDCMKIREEMFQEVVEAVAKEEGYKPELDVDWPDELVCAIRELTESPEIDTVGVLLDILSVCELSHNQILFLAEKFALIQADATRIHLLKVLRATENDVEPSILKRALEGFLNS